MLAGFALRLYRLDWQSLWYDELFSAWYSGMNLAPMLQAIIPDVVNPPLHYFLLHYWMLLFGSGDASVRMPSVLAGAATVAMTYPIARRLVDANVALVATLLMAISQIAIEYSQEARAYALAQMLSVFCIWFWLEARRTRSWGYWWLFTASSVILVYTHYYAASILIALALWTLLDSAAEPVEWTKWATLLAVGAAAYLPWLLTGILGAFRSIHRVVNHPGSIRVARWYSPLSAIEQFNSSNWTGFPIPHPLVDVAGCLLFLVPALFTVATLLFRTTWSRASRRTVALLTVLVIVPMALPIGLGLVAHVQFTIRYVLFALVPYYILAAMGICSLRPVWLKGTFLVIVCLFSMGALRSTYFTPEKPAYREAVHYLSANYQPGDCIVFSPENHDGAPYYWRVYSPEGLANRAATASCSRQWLVWDDTPWKAKQETPRKAVVATLSQGYVPLPEVKFHRISVQLFGARAATKPRQ